MKTALRCVIAVLCCAVWIVQVPSSSAQDQVVRARYILSEPSKSPSEAREALLALGDAAIDPIVDALAKEKQAVQSRQVFLVGILASLHSANANRALRRVLDDARPLVRATAALALGRNHEACAVPRLLRLVGDETGYGEKVSTDPHSETTLTVGMAASKALNSITGVHADASGKDRANAESWWDKNKNRLDCRNWN
jgi:hypothetical protein